MNRDLIQPRIYKDSASQAERTKKHAEVFTPSWVCNRMNNHCDEVWFGRAGVFNTEKGTGWLSGEEKIVFPEKRTWRDYVDSRRLEITCGEAPFLVSRYDASTGEYIPPKERIGQLDRKLRVVSENAADESEWMKWTLRAFQSTYGYEFQGDNLLIGRINLLMTFVDYLADRWGREPLDCELRKLANIIAWNLWQMDGLKHVVPFGVPEENCEQLSFIEAPHVNERQMTCRIMDWRADRSVPFRDISKGCVRE